MSHIRHLPGIIKNRINKSPSSLNHVVTYSCNANCEMCGRRQKKQNIKNELSLDECFDLLDNISEAGIKHYNMYGGEPLIRKDIPEILKYAKLKKKLIVSITTNGYYLPERYKEISPYIDTMVVSIDAVSTLHDKIRKVNGLFDRAVEGINLLKGKTKISINSVISSKNKNSVPDLIALSNELKVPVFIQPMVAQGYNDDLGLSHSEEQELYKQLLYYKDTSARLLNSRDYIVNLMRNTKPDCHAPKISIRIEGDGTIGFCNNSYWGNIRETRLKDIFSSKEFKDFCIKMESCKLCSSACTTTSMLYNNPFYAFKVLIEYLRYQK